MLDTEALASALANSEESHYVRLTAFWIQRAERYGVDLEPEPDFTGNEVIDALVAAAVEHVARRQGKPTPRWARQPSRSLNTFWHPGYAGLFANALVHSPAAFSVRGIFIEADSLESV